MADKASEMVGEARVDVSTGVVADKAGEMAGETPVDVSTGDVADNEVHNAGNAGDSVGAGGSIKCGFWQVQKYKSIKV